MARIALVLAFSAMLAAGLPAPGLYLALGLGISAIGMGIAAFGRRAAPGAFRLTAAAAITVGTLGVLLGATRVAIALAAVGMTPSFVAVSIAGFVIGWGFGWSISPSLVAAQSSVPWNERGVVTGVQAFGRSLGSAVGAAVLGAIANGVIALTGRASTDPRAVTLASTWVFVVVAVLVVATIGTALAMLRLGRPQRDPITGSIQTAELAA